MSLAPFERLWPNELHVCPTPVALACKVLCGHQVLTSGVSLAALFHRLSTGRDVRTLDDLSDAATALGLRAHLSMGVRDGQS